MQVFSENLYLFSEKATIFLKDILKKECGIDVKRSRFLLNNYFYPLHIVMIESDTKLGYFDPHTYQIALNQNLSYTAKESVLKDILRHELAHYLQYIETGSLDLPHGEVFKNICARYGWHSSISKASLDIELANEVEGNLEMERMINKIKNLLNLAASDNVHEAELATLKANELILKYNIKHFEFGENKKIYTATLLESKRKNTKLTSIYDILKTFMVRPVLVYGKNLVRLEASGTRESIELAQYVAHFLDLELDLLWKNQNELKGTRAKNSFFLGIAKGYLEKFESIQAQYSEEQSRALVLINKDIDQSVQRIYRRLSTTGSGARTDSSAFNAGKKSGKNLSIQNAIKNKTKGKLLSWRSQ